MQDIYTKINEQLSQWITCASSNRDFALNHNIDEKTVRRILTTEYQVSIKTLQKICEARNISLSDFFALLENN